MKRKKRWKSICEVLTLILKIFRNIPIFSEILALISAKTCFARELRKQAGKEVIKIENKKHRMSASSFVWDMDKLLSMLKPGDPSGTSEEKTDDSEKSSDTGVTFYKLWYDNIYM